jgi:hypothetical protein
MLPAPRPSTALSFGRDRRREGESLAPPYLRKMTRLLIGLTLCLAIASGYRLNHTSRAAEAGERQVRYATMGKNFGLFESKPEALPGPVRSRLSRLLKEPNEPFNPSQVQRSQSNAGIVWTFVVGDQVCLAQGAHGAAACVAMDIAISEGVSVGTFSPPSKRIHKPHGFLVLGLAPDGVGRVELKIGERRRTTVVKGNLYSVSSNQSIFIRRLVRETN